MMELMGRLPRTVEMNEFALDWIWNILLIYVGINDKIHSQI